MAAGDKHNIHYDRAQNDHSIATLRTRLTRATLEVRRRVALHPESRVVKWHGLMEELDAVDRRAVVAGLVEPLKRGNWNHPYKAHFRALLESRSFVEIVEQLLPDLTDADVRDLVSGAMVACIGAKAMAS